MDTSPCTLSAEVLGGSNFTSITIDLQHGMLDFNHCRNIFKYYINMMFILKLEFQATKLV